MKILIVNFEYPPLGGGGGVATKQMGEELGKRHDVHILTTAYGELPLEEVTQGITIHRVRVWGRNSLPTSSLLSLLTFVPAAVWRGWHVCRTTPFAVINAQFVVPSGIPAVILAKAFKVPFVLSFIGGDIYDPTKGISPHRHWWLRWLIRQIARQAVLSTAISGDTKRRAQELHLVTTPIIVTPLGLVQVPAAPATRTQLQLPTDVPLFVAIGRLIPRKGYAVLIRSWQAVSEAHLVIVGSGPQEAELKQLIQECNLTDRVHLVGFVDEVRKQQILSVADGYISTADHEGFGIVFLEAMAAGLPIIAMTNGGQTDFLESGKNAVLLTKAEPALIAAAVQQLLADPALRQQMGAANSSKVKDYSIAATTEKFEKVLQAAAALPAL